MRENDGMWLMCGVDAWEECGEDSRVCGRAGSSMPKRGGPGEDKARLRVVGTASVCDGAGLGLAVFA